MEEAGQPATLSAFLEEIALVADIDSVDPDQDYVLLMTLHSAKGLEFPNVFIVGMEDGGFFPGGMLPSGPVIRRISRRSEGSVMWESPVP